MNHAAIGHPTRGRVLHAARLYDLGSRLFWRGGALRATLLQVAAPASGEAVLDVGCGPGTLVLELKARVGDGAVYGIDASPEMIDLARSKARQRRADVDFRVAAIEDLPFADETFHLVTSSLMLHHLPDDLKERGQAEVRRVLKPGGRFVLVDFAHQSHGPHGPGRALGHLLSILGHSHGASSVEQLEPMLRNAGFEQVESLATEHHNFVFLGALRPA